jgi:hypothetical protein
VTRGVRLGEREEVAAFVWIEAKGFGDRGDHERGRVDVAALFQPGVPAHPDVGELGHFLAAKAGDAAVRCGVDPKLLGVQAGAPGAQESGEHLSSEAVPVGAHGLDGCAIADGQPGALATRTIALWNRSVGGRMLVA